MAEERADSWTTEQRRVVWMGQTAKRTGRVRHLYTAFWKLRLLQLSQRTPLASTATRGCLSGTCIPHHSNKDSTRSVASLHSPRCSDTGPA